MKNLKYVAFGLVVLTGAMEQEVMAARGRVAEMAAKFGGQVRTSSPARDGSPTARYESTATRAAESSPRRASEVDIFDRVSAVADSSIARDTESLLVDRDAQIKELLNERTDAIVADEIGEGVDKTAIMQKTAEKLRPLLADKTSELAARLSDAMETGADKSVVEGLQTNLARVLKDQISIVPHLSAESQVPLLKKLQDQAGEVAMLDREDGFFTAKKANLRKEIQKLASKAIKSQLDNSKGSIDLAQTRLNELKEVPFGSRPILGDKKVQKLQVRVDNARAKAAVVEAPARVEIPEAIRKLSDGDVFMRLRAALDYRSTPISHKSFEELARIEALVASFRERKDMKQKDLADVLSTVSSGSVRSSDPEKLLDAVDDAIRDSRAKLAAGTRAPLVERTRYFPALAPAEVRPVVTRPAVDPEAQVRKVAEAQAARNRAVSQNKLRRQISLVENTISGVKNRKGGLGNSDIAREVADLRKLLEGARTTGLIDAKFIQELRGNRTDLNPQVEAVLAEFEG